MARQARASVVEGAGKRRGARALARPRRLPPPPRRRGQRRRPSQEPARAPSGDRARHRGAAGPRAVAGHLLLRVRRRPRQAPGDQGRWASSGDRRAAGQLRARAPAGRVARRGAPAQPGRRGACVRGRRTRWRPPPAMPTASWLRAATAAWRPRPPSRERPDCRSRWCRAAPPTTSRGAMGLPARRGRGLPARGARATARACARAGTHGRHARS